MEVPRRKAVTAPAPVLKVADLTRVGTAERAAVMYELQRLAGNAAVARALTQAPTGSAWPTTAGLQRQTAKVYAPKETPWLDRPPTGVKATIVDETGAVLVFDQPVSYGQAILYVWDAPPSDTAVIQPDPSERATGRRYRRFKLRLGGDKELIARMRAELQAPYAAAEKTRRVAVERATAERAPLGDLLRRLDELAFAAKGETGGKTFQKAVGDFRLILDKRVQALAPEKPLPADVKIVMQALILWSRDSGDQWGEGVWDSDDLVMSASDYATVPASQYKCNAYIAEVLYRSLGLVHKVIQQTVGGTFTGKWFPYQAQHWGDPKQHIPNFPVVNNPKMGDIWSNGSHTGIYLGTYQGKNLYISARDDGDGVFALGKVQQEYGIQIKYITGGIVRRYTP